MIDKVDCPRSPRDSNSYARGKSARGNLPRRGFLAISWCDHLPVPRCNGALAGRMRREFLQTPGLTSCIEDTHSAYTGVNFPSVEGPLARPGKDAGPCRSIENNPYPARSLGKSALWSPPSGVSRKLSASTGRLLSSLVPPENSGSKPPFSAVAVSTLPEVGPS
jgi:hypothetical protein